MKRGVSMRRIIEFLLMPISMLFHGLIRLTMRVRQLRAKRTRILVTSSLG